VIASIPSPSQPGFSIGPFEIHMYGLMYAIAVTAAVIVTRRRWSKLGGDPELPHQVAIWGFPPG
jgi:prolipoprotein diacylglyceryltransferase